MKDATYEQVQEYLRKAKAKGVDLIELKNEIVNAGWTINLKKVGELHAGEYGRAITKLCHNPELIKDKPKKKSKVKVRAF